MNTSHKKGGVDGNCTDVCHFSMKKTVPIGSNSAVAAAIVLSPATIINKRSKMYEFFTQALTVMDDLSTV